MDNHTRVQIWLPDEVVAYLRFKFPHAPLAVVCREELCRLIDSVAAMEEWKESKPLPFSDQLHTASAEAAQHMRFTRTDLANQPEHG